MVETKQGTVNSPMEDYTPTELRVAQENPHFSHEDVLAVAALRSSLICKGSEEPSMSSKVVFAGTRVPESNGVYLLADGRFSRFLNGQWRAPSAQEVIAAAEVRLDGFPSPQFRIKEVHRWSKISSGNVESAMLNRRQIGGFGDTWVGGLAWSEIPEDHKGSCRVSFISHTGRTDTAVFPSYEEAKGAAGYGISVEIGGCSEVVISAAAEDEAVTHLTYMSWLEGVTHSQPANEITGSADQSAELIASRIAADIALLRQVCIEPMSIKLSESIDIEVRPANDDDRVLVGRTGWGYTVVNYTSEGLIMDVYAEGNIQPVQSTSIYSDELETPHSDLHDTCGTTK